MLYTNPILIVSLLFGILLLLSACKTFSLSREKKLLAEQLTDTTMELDRVRKELTAAEEKNRKFTTFNERISTPELTTQLQKPRLQTVERHNSSSPPEKYSYVHSLAEKGMAVNDIASLLSISPHETQQLVNLSRIARAA